MATQFEQIGTRAQHILRMLVDTYLETGEPVGSRTLSRLLGTSLSPATIRNVMADLEEAGLLFSPHTSAGRLPTPIGLRFFVDALLERRTLSDQERLSLESDCAHDNRDALRTLEKASSALSGLSGCAGLVLAPKSQPLIKQIEFVPLGPGRALVVIVDHDDNVENRLLELPVDVSVASLVSASNYMTARLANKTMDEARDIIAAEISAQRSELDRLAAQVVATGMAAWSGQTGQLIVRGQSQLLNNVKALDDLERIRKLFALLEQRESMLKLLEMADHAAGVQIFIGAEHDLFSDTGCSMVITPFKNTRQQIVGAIGVIGPTRLNYARIIPMVDYTATVLSKLLG